VSNSEMSNFCSDQGRGERRAGQKRPFMDGH